MLAATSLDQVGRRVVLFHFNPSPSPGYAGSPPVGLRGVCHGSDGKHQHPAPREREINEFRTDWME